MKRLVIVLMLVILILTSSVGGIITVKADSKLGLLYAIVVANSSLKDTVQDFMKFKESQGFDVIIESVDVIEKNYQGIDRVEKIRNFLKEKTKNYPKSFTLLIGVPYDKNKANSISTGGDVPMRIIYPPDIYIDVKDDYFPTDFYYADLKGNWDANVDGIYGNKGDNINYKVSNFVGRIPFSANKTVEKILDNTIALSNTPLTHKVLLTEINHSDSREWDKAKYMENTRINILEPNGFSVTTLYEKEGEMASIYSCTAPLNRENFNKYLCGNDIIVTNGHGGIFRGVWNDTNQNGKQDKGEIDFISFFDITDLNTTQCKTKIWYDFGCITAFGSWNIHNGYSFVTADTILEQGIAAVVIGVTGNAYFPEVDIDSFFNTLIITRRPIGEWLYNTEYRRQNIYGDKICQLKLNIEGDPSFGLYDDSLTICADVIPPSVQIISPGNDSITNDSEITITGIVSDIGSGIKRLEINSNSVTFTNNSFSTSVELREGENVIIIVVIDKAGNRYSQKVRVYYKNLQLTTIFQIGNPYMIINNVFQEIDPGRGTMPVIKNNRALVPIRAIVEALGGIVEWDGKERKVTINLKDVTIELWIGKSIAKVDGLDTPIDATNPKVVPEIINCRTMLPLRFIAENLGCQVNWEPNTKTITITYLRGG